VGETTKVPVASPRKGVAATGTRRPGASRYRTRAATPYLFMAPYLLLFVVFVALPAVFGLWMSLHDWDYMLDVQPFVGLDNYLRLFREGSTAGGLFWQSMRATALFILFSVPPLIVIPLGVALILNRRFPGRTFFRAVYFAPYVLGVAVIGVLFRFVLDPNIGLVNYYLGQLGFSATIPWTTAMPWAWIALVGVTVWWTLGFNAVIYLAGLQDIPRDLYEAASVDGASPRQQFWNITLPGLRRVLLFVITITVLASANMFGQSYLITQGGPGTRTRTAIMYIAEEGLGSFRMGRAAAMSYLLALFLVAVAVVMFAVFRRYGED
jgi:multiple sugar transport system permease protein